MHWRVVVPPALAASTFMVLGACKAPGPQRPPIPLEKAAFPVLPYGKFSAKMRAKGDLDPKFAARMFWGNYGGPGNLAGPPVDAMDRLYYEHDIAYLQGVKLRQLRAADRLLVRELRKMDSSGLTSDGKKFRRRAMLYFRLPVSRWVGKPGDVLLRTKSGPAVVWTDQ